jgi:O-antigen/teichoic acid export membrane protein
MQSDQILVFAFVSLKMVAYYGNYTLITSKLTQLFNTFMGSVWASVGNLVAEGNKKKILQVFWEIQSIYFLIAGLVVFSIYHFIDSFICLWLGEEYILNETILILLLINVFIMLIRNTVDMFNGAYGHFADTWSAWAEGISNIAITLLLAPFMGVSGILIGKIVSLVLFVILWKPYYLFHKGLHLSVKRYWIYTIRYLGLFVISFYLGHWFYLFIPIDDSTSFMAWFGKVIFSLLPFTLIYYMSMYLYGNGMKDITIRFLIKLKVLK